MNEEQEFYQLWIECLKRSKPYKDYCERRRTDFMGAAYDDLDLLMVYADFGDIFAADFSFKRWWKNRGKYKVSVGGPVMLMDDMYERDRSRLDISIDPTYADDGILKEVKRLLKEKRKDPYTKGVMTWNRRVLTLQSPNSRRRLDQWSLYLRVYDLHIEGLEIPEIIRKLESNGKYDDPHFMDQDNLERLYRMYREKAEKLISNVEQGIFPGDVE